jgi:hypothetical protein
MSSISGLDQCIYKHIKIILTTAKHNTGLAQVWKYHGEESWPPTSCLHPTQFEEFAPKSVDVLKHKVVKIDDTQFGMVNVSAEEMTQLRSELQAANNKEAPVPWTFPTSFLGLPVKIK